MSQTVLRSDVASVLTQWKDCVLSNEQVFHWANERFLVEAWDSENGAVNEVLAHLDGMDMNLITPEDVPMLLAALEAETIAGAAQVISFCNASIDWVARKQKLANDPLYAAFCK